MLVNFFASWKFLRSLAGFKPVFPVVISLLSSAFEVLGLAFLPVFATWFLNSDSLSGSSIEVFKMYFNEHENIALLFMLFWFLGRSLFFVGNEFVWSRFVYVLFKELSAKIFVKLGRMSIDVVDRTEKAEFIKTAHTELKEFCSVVAAMGSLLTESLVLAGLILVSLFYFGAFTIGVAVLASLLAISVYWLSHRVTARLSKLRESSESEIITQLLNYTQELRFLRLSGRSAEIRESLSRTIDRYSDSQVWGSVLNGIPRAFFELAFACIFLVALMLISSMDKSEISGALPILLACGVFAMRLFPSVSRIVSGLNSLNFHASCLPPIVKLLESSEDSYQISCPPELKRSHCNENTLSVSGVGYFLNGKPLFENVSLEAKPGQVVIVKGPSGSGKSTLLDILCGFKRASIGEIWLNGVNLSETGVSARTGIFSFVPQFCYLFGRSIGEAVGGVVFDHHTVCKLLEVVGLNDLSPQTMLTSGGTNLSGGERQRIGIARALYQNTPVLVLDEPTASLDSDITTLLVERLGVISAEKILIIASHDPLCDKIADLVVTLD